MAASMVDQNAVLIAEQLFAKSWTLPIRRAALPIGFVSVIPHTFQLHQDMMGGTLGN